jgi:predicted AlkP superfamily pyrophosphatase or phosphodiesterase
LEIDAEVKKLVEYFEHKNANVVILSEYGITNVSRPIHLNRILRKADLLAIRKERGLELLDAGASKAFAVVDHQIAHVYLNDKSIKEEVHSLLLNVEGVEQVLESEAIKENGLNHVRSGDFVLISDKNSWFTYYFWEDDTKAPDYARMVDIHKKPGYDPVEMFTDPNDKLVIPKVIFKLLKKKLGFRTVMDIIPLKAELVKGSHGRIPEDIDDWPVILSNTNTLSKNNKIGATDVFSVLEQHIKL